MAGNRPPQGLMLRELFRVEGFVSSDLGLPRREGYWWLLFCENRKGGRSTLAGGDDGFHQYVEPLLGEGPSLDEDRWDVELGPEVMLGFGDSWDVELGPEVMLGLDLHAFGWVTEWMDEDDLCWRWCFFK